MSLPARVPTTSQQQPLLVPIDPDVTLEALRLYRQRVDEATEDTLGAIQRRRGIVRMVASDDEIRYIARHAARYALGMSVTPDRKAASECSRKQRDDAVSQKGRSRVTEDKER